MAGDGFTDALLKQLQALLHPLSGKLEAMDKDIGSHLGVHSQERNICPVWRKLCEGVQHRQPSASGEACL